MSNTTPAAIWLNVQPKHIQDRTAIKLILATLSTLDESEYSSFKDIWTDLNRLFSHMYSEQVIMRAIAESKYWPLLLEGLK